MSSDNSWRLLVRQNLPEQYSALFFVNPPADLDVTAPNASWHIYAHQSIYTDTGQLKTNHFVGAFLPSQHLQWQTSHQAVVVFLPKEKSLARFLFAQLAQQLPLHTPCYIVGANDSGIRALAKLSIPGFAPLEKYASGHHCQLLRTQLLNQQDFVAKDTLNFVNLNTPITATPTYFLPGVFGENKLDAGTELLLQHLPQKISGQVLDFGCGSGVISHWLCSHRSPSQLIATDLSSLAQVAAHHTLAPYQEIAEVRLSDGFQQINERFHWIISNPPFHQGKRTDYQITTNFIKTLKQHLQPAGRVLIVANRFLPWPNLLQEEFSQVTTLAQNNRFTLTLAHD